MIAAVAYLRMSDKKQDKSIPAQRAEIERFAKANGYTVVRWYADHGISGAENQKRVEFQRLILDAQERCDFQAVIVWDQDRFSRFDPMEANYYWFILRQAGVRIITVATGELDFSGLGGWLTASVAQHGKAQYLRDLSRNVLRGRLAKANRGQWQGNRAPYGYRIVNKGDIVADEVTAPIVDRMFNRYADGCTSLWDIAHELNEEGIAAPRGKAWTSAAVRVILRRECYATGQVRQLCNPKGKFNAVVNGNIVASGSIKFDRGEGIMATCPTLIAPDLWERTHANLKRRQQATSPRKIEKGSVLIGLMHCANCGGKMYAGDKARGKHASDRVYWCSTYHRQGHHCCTRNLIHESAILDYLVPKLQAMLLSPENLERLAAALKRQAGQKQKPALPVDIKAMRKRLESLDSDIAAAVRELKRLPDDLHDLAVDDLRRLRKQREALAAAVAAQNAAPSVSASDKESSVRVALDRAKRLQGVLVSADPKAVRRALGELIDRIDLWFEPIRGKKITRSALTRGVIRLRQSSDLLAQASRRCSRRF